MMALLRPICIQSQLISISIYFIPRAPQRGVRKAQALRLRRICSTAAAFEQRAADLTKFLGLSGKICSGPNK